jgi:hypothetical protein
MKRMTLVIVMIMVLIFASGCANYGLIRPADNEMNIETLVKNWKDYDVSWTGLSLGEPTALMFDPRGNGKKLVGSIWYKVESKKDLLSIVSWLKTNQLYYPLVWTMRAPDGELYGYLYTGWERTVVKPLDKSTIWVYGIPATLRGDEEKGFPTADSDRL